MTSLANITNTIQTEKADMDTPSKVLGGENTHVKMNLKMSEFKKKEMAGELKPEPIFKAYDSIRKLLCGTLPKLQV